VSEPSTVGFYATEPVMLWDDCLAEPGPIFVLGQTLDPSIIWISLAAGKYNLTRISGNVFDPLSYPQDFSLRLVAQRPADFLASSCEGATTIPLDAQTKTNVRFPSTVSLSGWLRVGGPAESAFSVELDQFILEIPNYSGIHGEILFCDACGADASCQNLQPLTSFAFFGGGVIRLTNVYASSSPANDWPNAGFIFTPI
jgi:hypothetical protein